MSVLTNIKLVDVRAAFEAIEESGRQLRFFGNEAIRPRPGSRVRSVAFYDYFLMAAVEEADANCALVVIDLVKNRVLHAQPLDPPAGHCLGGIEVVGDFLLAPFSHEEGGYVELFGLSGMSTVEGPLRLSRSIPCKHRSSAVGMTNFEFRGLEHYLLACYDSGRVRFQLSNGYCLTDEDCRFDLHFEGNLRERNYSQISLVTEVSEQIFLLGFRTESTLRGHQDVADLFRVDVARRVIKRIGSRRLFARHEHGAHPGALGSHFSWGGALRIRTDRSFSLFAPQGTFEQEGYFVNEFVPLTQSRF